MIDGPIFQLQRPSEERTNVGRIRLRKREFGGEARARHGTPFDSRTWPQVGCSMAASKHRPFDRLIDAVPEDQFAAG